MKAKWAQTVASAVIVAYLAASAVPAQEPAATSTDQFAPQARPQPTAGQLDQMLAPVALYPDGLLGQVLMAAGYPLEVVEADRWLQDPNNVTLRGDQLAAALAQQSWDPSVESLVAFPQVLNMMSGQLDWTESLGEAFIDNPSAVMDAVQRLRRQAEAAGKLRSNAQEIVTDQDGEITIEPANAQTVYVPDYEPTVVYGPWPYPDWPPYYFPDYWDNCAFDDFGYCWFGVPLIIPLWGWDHWDWRNHRIDIDRDRFTGLNRGRPPIGSGAWEHDPSHRGNVPYQSPAARERFQGALSHPGGLGATRGYPTGAGEYAPSSSRLPPTFQSYGPGADARAQAERGENSRATMPSYQPRSAGGFSRGGAPSGRGGGRR
ncbi:MAG: DUF3300 domain-containing protein [Devosia sp.]|nr:DUF3300 domain-containing protein [Devosia sp.]